MNIFNRVLIILLLVVLLMAAAAVLLVTLGVAGPAQLAPHPWFADRLAPFAQLDPTNWWWAVGISSALLVLGLILLVAELQPGPIEPKRMTLKEDPLGRVTVTLDGVRELVAREAGRVDGVMEVDARVREERQGLVIMCRAAVDPTRQVPDLTEELRTRVREAVEHHLGRQVAIVQVDTQLAPLTARRVARRVR